MGKNGHTIICATVRLGSEDNLGELVLSFCHEVPEAGLSVGSECLFPLSLLSRLPSLAF